MRPDGLPTQKEVERIRRTYKPGMRIKLSNMDDPYPVPPGAVGTIRLIDDAGQIHVDWDCGRALPVIPGIDDFRIIKT